MEKETNNSTYQYPSTFDELIDDMQNHADRYKHLQIILNRKIEHSLGLGQKYFVVNNIGFGVYQLNDVDYSNGKIYMTLTNTSTGNTAEISLDVNNEHPEHFLICWNDIKQMAYAESTIDYTNDELLEQENK
ncbi:MAG: hypothetical protein MUO72_17590 [Bacteroidales bacterium]|nr:hypothetical protein [Bacteroidales bacterium]